MTSERAALKPEPHEDDPMCGYECPYPQSGHRALDHEFVEVWPHVAATRGEPPEPGPAIDAERLARALANTAQTRIGGVPVEADWLDRETARIIAAEYDRLRP